MVGSQESQATTALKRPDRYYYLADGLSSTMAVVDASGVVQDSYTYDVYGTPSKTGSLANEFDFAGQQTDGTGLQYLRARYYDPATGTFLSRDPMASIPVWTGHGVGYSYASPANLADPSGLDSPSGDWGGVSCRIMGPFLGSVCNKALQLNQELVNFFNTVGSRLDHALELTGEYGRKLADTIRGFTWDYLTDPSTALAIAITAASAAAALSCSTGMVPACIMSLGVLLAAYQLRAEQLKQDRANGTPDKKVLCEAANELSNTGPLNTVKETVQNTVQGLIGDLSCKIVTSTEKGKRSLGRSSLSEALGSL